MLIYGRLAALFILGSFGAIYTGRLCGSRISYRGKAGTANRKVFLFFRPGITDDPAVKQKLPIVYFVSFPFSLSKWVKSFRKSVCLAGIVVII